MVLDPEKWVPHLCTKQPLKPAIPFDRNFEVSDSADVPINFARWLTAPENPVLARALANRIS